jgi:Mrp family chromosome partitioning ATPase
VLQESRTYPGITVLAPGTDTDADPATGAGFARVLDELRHRFDVVVVQTPSVDQEGDASGHIIAGMTDGALLVAELNQTRKDRFADALALLNRMSTPVIGAVTTGGGTRHRHTSKKTSAPRSNARAPRFAPSGAGVSGNLGSAGRPTPPSVAPAAERPETSRTDDEGSGRAAGHQPPPVESAPTTTDRPSQDRPLQSGPSPSASTGWPEPSPSSTSGDASVGYPRP